MNFLFYNYYNFWTTLIQKINKKKKGFIQKCSEKEKKESIETLYFSNLFALPFLIIFFFVTNEFTELGQYVQTDEQFKNSLFVFLIIFLAVIFCGCFLCFSQIWCTTNNNAITTSVIGVLKSFLQTLLGLFFYDAYRNMTVLSFVGILINLAFGTYYTYLKYIEKESRIQSSLNSSHSDTINDTKA